MTTITHYWSIIKLSNPPTVQMKTDDGRFFWGWKRDTGFDVAEECTEPRPIIGYDPDTHKFGYSFGEWIPVEMWRDKR